MKNIYIKNPNKFKFAILFCGIFASVTFADNSFDIANNNYSLTGKQVFEKYCWGCHHQKSTAFGPSFSQIANTRTKSQASLHIANPELSYKQLGYKRTAMPAFGAVIKTNELNLILDYIFSFKETSKQTTEIK